ncbi:prolipoprotein diacylglyceryl transferase [Candidatus Similichlamydia laticola]|nr:prolipoprotein diacylglyceryl transferase family protein [Candidatus Similichlamydia laticola]
MNNTTYFTWSVHPLCLCWQGLQVRWYSLFLCLGWIMAFLCFDRQTAHLQLSPYRDQMKVFFFLFFLVGARMGLLLETKRHFACFDLFSLEEGGLVGQAGGLFALGGAVLGHFTYQPAGVSLFLLLDWISLSLLPCLVFTRLGNFFNHEVLGLKTTSCLGIIFKYAEYPRQIHPVHPVQLYEIFGYSLGYFLVQKITDKKSPQGMFFGRLCLTLGCIRFVLEFLKEDSERGFPSLGQWLSLVFICLGLLFQLRRKSLYKASCSSDKET